MRCQMSRMAATISSSDTRVMAVTWSRTIGQVISPSEAFKPVGDRVRGIVATARSGLQRTGGVVGRGRLAAVNRNMRRIVSDGQGGAADQATAADRRDHCVQIGHVLDQFGRTAGLAGDDAQIIVRRDEFSAGLRDERIECGLAGGVGGFAEDDVGAVAAHGIDLGLGRGFRHDHRGGDAAGGRGARQRLAVIAAGMRGHAARGLLGVERKHGVGGATRLERAGFLKVLALEEQRGTGGFVERAAGQNRRAMDVISDALAGGHQVGGGRTRHSCL